MSHRALMGSPTTMRTTLLASLTLLAAFWSRPADACGCFTPPDPTVPLVQAGERILFAVDQGHRAHSGAVRRRERE
jgi:hypothetical protein